MAILGNMFGKGGGKAAEKVIVTEPKLFSILDSQEAYFRYLYPRDTELPLTIPQKLVVEMVKTSLQKKEVRNKAVPRLPTVIPKLLRSLRDPDSSARDYVEIINKDPVMSAAVLKLANSVYFNPIGKRIDDIEPAVVKLGINGIRSVLSAAVMQPIIQKDSAYFSQSGQRMWHHSLSCAVACELIAEHRDIEKFKVYVMGLVHDIGKTTVFSELCKQFKKNGENVKPGYNAFVPLMKVLAPAVSYWVAKDWDLPKEVCTALAEQTNIQAGNKVSPYAELLCHANIAAECYVTIRHQNVHLADNILEELKLPKDLYERLDQLSKDV
ncbi:MAG: Fis family transcriptional regulator [Alteromonadaceae bacterium]|nr:MAG: Fis family transcriptional regulator [Alteromonadaceae bacterium]